MQSLFPHLFFLSFLAPILLRVAIAFVFLYDAKTLLGGNTRSKAFGAVLGILAILIGAGVATQAAVLVAAVEVVMLAMNISAESVFKNKLLSILTIAILLFLLIAGPGGLAFDLPY